MSTTYKSYDTRYHIEIIVVVLQKEWFKPCVSFTTLYGRSIEYDRIGIPHAVYISIFFLFFL